MKLKCLVCWAALGTLALAGCGGGGGGSSRGSSRNNGDSGDTRLPGVYLLNTAGGAGAAAGGTGGDGGAVTVAKEAGSGDVSIVRGGEADATFSPLVLIVGLGSNPLTVTADTRVVFAASEPPAGTPYLMTYNNPRPNLFISDGDGVRGDEPPVTGIWVGAGATLTFELNAGTAASVLLTDDIENHGTITTADVDGSRRGSLEITLDSYLGDGTLTTAGQTAGQSGGYLYLYAGGSVVNRGPVDTRGADHAAGSGGNGGDIEIYADDRFENTAAIRSAGGAASGTGYGGHGGYVDLLGTSGFSNGGEIVCAGGHGALGGGNGGWVWFEVYTAGDLRNCGDVNSSGGNSAGGDGGAGGEMDIYAYGGRLIQSADLTAAGGEATGIAGNGGAGGYLILGVFQGYNVAVPAGDLIVSGHLTTAGGNAAGGNGGRGGSVDLNLGNYDPAAPNLEGAQRLTLLGYQSIDSRGGSGNFGGSGGTIDLAADAGYLNPAVLTNEADLVSGGGNAAASGTIIPAWGGKGGDVWLSAFADPANAANPRGTKVVNLGDIAAGGGDNREFDGSFWWGGAGGEVQFTGSEGVTNQGAISARGGRDPGTDGGITGYGGLGNWIVLTSGKGVANTGALDAGGGAGEYQGGGAGEVHLLGKTAVDSRGSLAAAGGNANPALFGSRGGDGGLVQVEVAEDSGTFSHTASVAVAGGTGALAGFNGQIILSR